MPTFADIEAHRDQATALKVAMVALLSLQRYGLCKDEEDVLCLKEVSKDIVNSPRYRAMSPYDIWLMCRWGSAGRFEDDGKVYKVKYNTLHGWLAKYNSERIALKKTIKPAKVLQQPKQKRSPELDAKFEELKRKLDANRD